MQRLTSSWIGPGKDLEGEQGTHARVELCSEEFDDSVHDPESDPPDWIAESDPWAHHSEGPHFRELKLLLRGLPRVQGREKAKRCQRHNM